MKVNAESVLVQATRPVLTAEAQEPVTFCSDDRFEDDGLDDTTLAVIAIPTATSPPSIMKPAPTPPSTVVNPYIGITSRRLSSSTPTSARVVNSSIAVGELPVVTPVINQLVPSPPPDKNANVRAEAMEIERVDNASNQTNDLMIVENQTNYRLEADVYDGPTANPPSVPFPPRQVFGRYTWRVHARTSDNPASALRSAILEIWEQLYATDPTLVIYPWAEASGSDPDNALTSPPTCPQSTKDILVFFNKAFPRPSGGTYYVEVRMGHDMDVKDLRRASAGFFGLDLNKNRIGYWYKALQHENPVEVGWLLGSSLSMSVDRLAAEILHRSGGQVEVGCRFHAIALKKYNPDLSLKDRYRAIHIEVKKEQQGAATQYLTTLFSSSRTSDFVMGFPMRFVPVISRATTPRSEQKCGRLRIRHGCFLSEIRNSRSWTIENVAFRSSRLNDQSLRDLILNIRVSTDATKQLFIACEPQDDGGTVFTFFESFTDEAYNRIHNLLAFLRFTNPTIADGITQGFSRSAQKDANNVIWDPETQTMSTPEDVAIAAVEDDLDNLFSGSDPDARRRFYMDLEGVTFPSPEAGIDCTQRPSDDSVSTFQSKRIRFEDQLTDPTTITPPQRSSSRITARSHTRQPRGVSRFREDGSIESEVTLESAMSRISQLEGNVVAMRNNVSIVRTDFSEFRVFL